MKNSIVFFLLISTVLISCSSKSSVSSPDEIGEQVTGLLNDMDDMILEDFSDYFMTAEEMVEMAKNEELDLEESLRDELSQTTESQLKLRHMFLYNRLKRRGEKLGINWLNVEMESFNHKLQDISGSKFYNGELIFKDGKSEYRIKTFSVYNGEDYYLLGVQGLMEVNSSVENDESSDSEQTPTLSF